MLNNLILVGRLADNPKLKVLDEGVKVCHFVLAVERPFQNQETGQYDADFIPVSVWRGFAETVIQYCKKGSTIGIKGRIAMKLNEINGIKFNSVEVIAERVSFISLKNQEKEEEQAE
ncbi:MAG: single-stranded DNA-binding protein [Bacilli bacterium]|jgi:single-strand DNA-binding protein|nr:single-stranded DNA-binding protein [Bacilli bacterium]